MGVYYKKRFTFYKNAPFDADGVNVAASLAVHDDALSRCTYVAYGYNASYKELYETVNFDPAQTVFFARFVPTFANLGWINYVKVDFYRPNTLTPAHTFFYFVESVDECDEGEFETGTELNTVLYRFGLKMDVWATRALKGGATFKGGILTRASVLTQGLKRYGDDFATRAELPFESSGALQTVSPLNRVPAFDSFCSVLQVTGKRLKKSLLLIDQTPTTAAGALASAQKFATADVIAFMGVDNMGEYIKDKYTEGQFSVQGAYVIPSALAPSLDTSTDFWAVFRDGDYETEYRYKEIRGDGAQKGARLSLKTLDAGSVLGNAPFISSRRFTVGTPFNRVDITEFFARGSIYDVGDDTIIDAVWGKNSFNIFMSAGRQPLRDITNDFQIFSLVDPENEYIRQNKTNAILSGIGSVGTIIGGVASIASGGGAAVGVGIIASGATGLVKTAGGFATAANAPMELSGGGYGDVAAYFGGIYYETSESVGAQWKTAVYQPGIGRRVQLDGVWTLGLTGEDETAFVFVNSLAASGVLVGNVCAGDGAKIAEMLQNGVRVWYDAERLLSMEY